MNSNSNPSPLETMASYAIAFLAGAATLALAAKYGDWRAKNSNQASIATGQERT